MKISGLNGEKMIVYLEYLEITQFHINVTSGSLGHGVGIGSGIPLDLKSKK